jgi:hypothetical protein
LKNDGVGRVPGIDRGWNVLDRGPWGWGPIMGMSGKKSGGVDGCAARMASDYAMSTNHFFDCLEVIRGTME